MEKKKKDIKMTKVELDCRLCGKKINRMENNMESTSHHLNKWYGFYNAMGRSSSCTCKAF